MPEFNLTKIEEKVQKFWQTNNVLKKSLALRQGKKKFVFYEGPPTANGLPHIGHFLTRAFKDLFIRYKAMRGFFVPRRAGWDTHGLPVEIEVEKELGLKSKKEIEKYGIAKFNKKAKESVWRYKTEWEKFSKRIGFWLDFDDPYITYTNDYIETLWHIVKQFDKKKFLYKGHKVLPWCPRCGTALSTHEMGQDDVYKTVAEDSVYVKFKIKSEKFKDAYILSWTTTPWTLPGNVALAVGEKINYALVSKDRENYILAEDLVNKVIDKPYKIEEIKVKDLIGLEYEPLFEVKNLKFNKSYKIYPADFVTTEEGTGVVHTAVMYGEDDYQLGEKIGLPKHHTVDKEGKFTKDVPEFAGQLVKDAEKGIIEYLKNKNLLFKVEPYTHEYPHCWRCKTPLLYYATDSWFVKTTAVKKQLIVNNKKINWIPEYIKEGRFGQWLNEVKDWAFSRDRYWGTPLPIWECNQCKNQLVIGSLEELEKHRYKRPNQYFILRHAEKGKNGLAAPDIISSKIDHDKYDLTKKGVRQAGSLALKLKNKKIDLIFSSPFLRTKKTAHIIAEKLGLKVKIDERLKETDHGFVCEGKDHFVCLPKGQYPPDDFSTKFGLDGESWNDVKQRMFSFIKELGEKYESRSILIVSHGDPLWLLEGITENLNNKELLDVKKTSNKYIKTGELKRVDFKNLPRDELGNLDLHRPYIDEVSLKCSNCEAEMKRVSEVIDVWFDSGAMPFAQGHWPFAQSKKLKVKSKNPDIREIDFPADFITEGVDQTRGWFYTLLAVSTLLGFGPPYKNVISLGHVLDKDGRKMSKSLGNVITPEYVIQKFGADAVRWWFYKVNQAGESKSFREEELKEIANGLVRVLTNSLWFWQLYKDKSSGSKLNFHKIDFHKSVGKNLNLLDQWLLSKWNSLIGLVTRSLDKYDATAASREIEKFVIEDLSNWWIRRSRDKFQLGESDTQTDLLRFILLELAKLTAPFTPFLAEYLHEELHHGTKSGMISVHFHDWPEDNKKLIDEELEKEMQRARNIITEDLALRKEEKLKVRQPLSKLLIYGEKFNYELENLIKDELNIKKISYTSKPITKDISIDLRGSGLAISGTGSTAIITEITPALRAEGWVREFMRMIQDARKDAGYKYDQKVEAFWFSEDRLLSDSIKREERFIKEKNVLKEFNQSRHDPKFAYDVEREQELEPHRRIWLGLKK